MVMTALTKTSTTEVGVFGPKTGMLQKQKNSFVVLLKTFIRSFYCYLTAYLTLDI